MNIKFIRVRDFNNYSTGQAFAIYHNSFPAHERQKEEVIWQRLNSGKEELHAGLKDDEVISMALVFNLSDSEFVLLDYIAVLEQERRSGTGTTFMQYLIQFYYESDKQMIMEVEDPNDGANLEERQRRVDFYKRLGAKSLQNVHYILPTFDGIQTTEMILMIFSEVNISELPRSDVEKLLLSLYEQVIIKMLTIPSC